MKSVFAIAFIFLCLNVTAQVDPEIHLLIKGTASIRGLSAADDNVVWASGSKGYVARSTDGGTSWNTIAMKGYEKSDFRDIEAFDSLNAIIMSSGTPALVMETHDGGKSWTELYRNNDSAIFLDAMDFVPERRFPFEDVGIIVGDPVNGKFFLLTVASKSHRVTPVEPAQCPMALTGEAAFAASGSIIKMMQRKKPEDYVYMLATGGKSSSLLVCNNKQWREQKCPIMQGVETRGIFSLDFKDETTGIVVGGDYKNDSLSTGNCYLTFDQGYNWMPPATGPRGYKSCVKFINGNVVVATGTSGTDVSFNGGMVWKNFSREAYNVIAKAKSGGAVFIAGPEGKIAKLVFP